jgi:uncharacterized membrane protein
VEAFVKSIKRYGLFFIIGAIGYAAIEVIWRGYTHWSMMIAGGLAFITFSVVSEKLKKKNILVKAAVCSLCVTAIEFIFGVIFNLWFKMSVWDYSHIPFNILGQICPIFTLIWAGLAIAFLPLADALNEDYA